MTVSSVSHLILWTKQKLESVFGRHRQALSLDHLLVPGGRRAYHWLLPAAALHSHIFFLGFLLLIRKKIIKRM